MKISRNKKRFWLTALVFIIFACVSWFMAARYLQLWPFSARQESQATYTSINYDEPTDSQLQEGAQTKQEVIESSKQDGQTTEETSTSSVGIDITVSEKSGDVFIVRTLIQKVSSGTCTLQMVGPNSITYSDTADVQPLASASTCKGFNVPMSKLSSGTWNITVTYSNGELSATTKKEVTI